MRLFVFFSAIIMAVVSACSNRGGGNHASSPSGTDIKNEDILSGFSQALTTPGMEMSDEEKVEISRHMAKNTDQITGLVNKMLELAESSSLSFLECDDNTSPVFIAGNAAIRLHPAVKM